ncbi:uncharacterized protein [Temnothorax longispinosus]|uniref:uncharacterized protein n=1 Tax=Temnothorax longispinosus TaxID=300112 RepID=UPI003A993940
MAPKKKTTEAERENKENEKLKRTLFNYREEDVGKALKAIRDGMPIATASKTYKVPRTTLRNKLSGRAPETSGRVGREAVLGHNIEERLAQWLLETSRMGFPINKDSLLYSVKKLLEKEEHPNPFKDNLPGRKWFEGFLRRHPRVTQKKAEHLCKARAVLTERRIRLWFADIQEQLGDKIEILQDPRRVFNMDETAVYLSPQGGIVLAEKGKSVYDVATNDKENVTTLFTVNAAGEFAPPLTVYKYKRLPNACIESAPANWGIGKTENGWMTTESFFEYFTTVFHRFLVENKIPLPIVVFLDGHVSHLSLQLCEFCKEKQIEICCFPSHATHILQPLDVAVFFPLKQKWKSLVRNWRIEHDGEDLQKHQVPSLLSRIITENDFSDTIKNGFKTCGLYPFDDNAVNYAKCIKENKKPNDDNPQTARIEPDQPQLTHRHYVESKIDSEVLERFKEKRASNETWDADDRNAALYELWMKIIDDEKKESMAGIHNQILFQDRLK